MTPDYVSRLFAYKHLPTRLQDVSKQFHDLAQHLATTMPANPELTISLRKLCEAKDAAVRSAVMHGFNE